MVIPTFATRRLILREITTNDYENYGKHFIDYEVVRWLASVVPWPYPKNGVQYYIEHEIVPHLGKSKWLWGIFLKTSPDELIGAIELRRAGTPDNRGFWLGKKFWRQGIMSEALTPITDYAFNTLAFEKLILTNAVSNHASHQIKNKMGAQLLYTESGEFVDPMLNQREIWELSKDGWQQYKG